MEASKEFERDYSIAPYMAMLIVLTWLTHLIYILTRDLNWIQSVYHILFQTFLSTGLFITAHDAMHGLVAPRNPRINKILGAVAIFLYGGFTYSRLLMAHQRHHDMPVTSEDPDYTRDVQERFFVWLAEFALRYYGWREFLYMHLHVAFVWIVGGAIWKVFAFFAIPAWMSALQLFYFGTYLPHRKNAHPRHDNLHFARSNEMPSWLSLITCYHFGYHCEHHEHPYVPWWVLPRIKMKSSKRLRDA
jgi:beta-carotene/zeaxanthin 4-ketolase